MATQLNKPLLGQYSFRKDSDRLATLVNLGGNGGPVLVPSANPAAQAIDASLYGAVAVSSNVATTFTITNLREGQMVRVVYTNSSGGNITNVFTGMTGLSTAIATTKIVSYAIFKVNAVIYFTQSALS